MDLINTVHDEIQQDLDFTYTLEEDFVEQLADKIEDLIALAEANGKAMADPIAMVSQFLVKAEQEDEPSEELLILSVKLIMEELLELARSFGRENALKCFNAMEGQLAYERSDVIMKDDFSYSKVDALDASVDLLYVLANFVYRGNLASVFAEAFEMVHENNMKKLHTDPNDREVYANKYGREIFFYAKGNLSWFENKDGKILKHPDHKGPDLNKLL